MKTSDIEYTNHYVLLKQTSKGWECLTCIDMDNLQEDVPEDFDICLAIPDPNTVPEWNGW